MTPRATYRLQFHAGFRFSDATALVPYLARLGISHVYASPYLRARAGSTHGYDIVNHNALNPELGSVEEFETFVDTLRAHGMGHILDFVPNHMGVGGCDNAWWLDLLTWGRDSHYADYFDVDWEPPRPQLRDKVLLPFLGRQYGEVLDAGDLHWNYTAGSLSLRYYEHCFPLAPPTYGLLLESADAPALRSFAPLFSALASMPVHHERREAAASLHRLVVETADAEAAAFVESLNATRTSPAGIALIDRVVEAQHWRPTAWSVAAEEINYRRFFDVNGLGALRMENVETFADAHVLVFALLERGRLDGLRLDHVDGLFDPLGYCELLRSRGALLGTPFYLVVEKILAAHEELRERWSVDGTTGYEFMNAVTGLAINGRSERAFDRLYRGFTDDVQRFEEVAFDAKRFVLTTALAAELNVLARRLDRIAQSDPHTRDFTLGVLTRALVNAIAAFPVYRTYVRGDGVSPEDRRYIDWALGVARARDIASEGSVYAFIRRVLLTEHADEAVRARFVDFAMAFQQLTSPVAAKGVEDTAFYRSLRLSALNEVGGDPGRFGTSIADFHAQNARRAARRPHAMLATSTHDAKRGEDVRARLAVLSEMPDTWRRTLARWSRLNARHLTAGDGGRAPSALAEYLFYQTIVGAWPNELLEGEPGAAVLGPFADRIVAYMLKAAREAKLRTSWTNPDAAYEAALERFVRRALDPRSARRFLADVAAFVRALEPAALTNSLAQTVLRATCPGVPDTYQGSELWDLALVDPDNRRPVDFAARDAALGSLDAALAAGTTREDLVRELLEKHDGTIKLYVLTTLLRGRASGTRDDAPYVALELGGPRDEHALAYMRGATVVVVSRLALALGTGLPLGDAWESTMVRLPADGPHRYRDVLTGATVAAHADDDGRILRLADALTILPVGVFEPVAP